MSSTPALLLSLAVLGTLALPARAEVYRCLKGDVTVYSDKPCAEGAQPARLPPAVVIKAGPQADLLRDAEAREKREAKAGATRAKAEQQWQQKHAEHNAAAERIHEGRASGKVVEGMTPADVRRIHGEPTVVSRSDGDKGERETWSYVVDGRRTHVTFENGKVSGVRIRETKK